MGTTDGGSREEKILVSVRLRPLNEKEIARNDVSDWECVNENTIFFRNGNLPLPDRSMYPTSYTFDRVFRRDCSTKQVYEQGAKEVALSVITGINSTVFAYGQTSSGKTYTMTGITEYALEDIYKHIEKHNEREYHLKFSAMEIYNESVRDLLSADTTPLRLLDDPERGTVVEKLVEEPLRDWDHAVELLSICEAQRQIGETALNETSSRSHQIIRLRIESSAREFSIKDNSSSLAASVSFVDLAGSERASQSLSAGTRLKEGCHINRSLLTLGTVIRKLSKGRNGHIPFRDSKLTRILQSSLGGNARTAIICTMSPARSHVEQSRNTLLFASCAKEVTTNAQVNVFMSDKALVKHLQRELVRLEGELRSPGSTFVISRYSALLQEKDLQIEKLEKEVIDLTLQRDVAQSQVQDLLQLVGNDGDSMKGVGLNNYPHLRIRRSPEIPLSLTSPLADPHSLDVGVRPFDSYQYSYAHSESSSNDHCIQLPDFEETFKQNNTSSSQLLVTTSKFIRSNSAQSWDEIDQQTNGTSEDLYKEVRCIETEESSTDQHSESDRSSPEDDTEISELMIDVNGDRTGQEFVSLPLKGDRELCYNPPFIAPPVKPSPWPLAQYTCSSQTLKLTKSRSCKGSLVMSPCSPWFEKVENNENTPPNGTEKEFMGRPEGIQRKLSELNYGDDVERLLRKGSRSSTGSSSAIEVEAQKDETLTSGNTPPNGIEKDFVEQPEGFQRQLSELNYSADVERLSGKGSQSSMGSSAAIEVEARKDKTLTAENTSPNAIEKEFIGRPEGIRRKLSELNYGANAERLLREGSRSFTGVSSAIEVEAREDKTLTDENVPRVNAGVTGMAEKAELQQEKQVADNLVHKAELKASESLKTVKDIGLDPIEDDSKSLIDWPSEFKRLQREIIGLWDACNVSLVHRTYFFLLFKGDPTDSIYMEVELRRLSFLKETFSGGNKTIEVGRTISPESSMKALRRERETLRKQMQKRLSELDRESLYLKWGIVINSKNRRLQLASRLWTNTEDMDHISDSAFIVAKLVGFIEPGQAPKEMFGLNLAPGPPPRRRSYSLKRSVISLL